MTLLAKEGAHKAICPLERHGELFYFRIINPDIFVNQTLIHPYTPVYLFLDFE